MGSTEPWAVTKRALHGDTSSCPGPYPTAACPEFHAGCRLGQNFSPCPRTVRISFTTCFFQPSRGLPSGLLPLGARFRTWKTRRILLLDIAIISGLSPSSLFVKILRVLFSNVYSDFINSLDEIQVSEQYRRTGKTIHHLLHLNFCEFGLNFFKRVVTFNNLTMLNFFFIRI